MSLITVLALSVITLLLVVVLAACSSFPNRSSADMDSPDGDWIGTARRSAGGSGAPATKTGQAVRATRAPSKMHSWI